MVHKPMLLWNVKQPNSHSFISRKPSQPVRMPGVISAGVDPALTLVEGCCVDSEEAGAEDAIDVDIESSRHRDGSGKPEKRHRQR